MDKQLDNIFYLNIQNILKLKLKTISQISLVFSRLLAIFLIFELSLVQLLSFTIFGMTLNFLITHIFKLFSSSFNTQVFHLISQINDINSNSTLSFKEFKKSFSAVNIITKRSIYICLIDIIKTLLTYSVFFYVIFSHRNFDFISISIIVYIELLLLILTFDTSILESKTYILKLLPKSDGNFKSYNFDNITKYKNQLIIFLSEFVVLFIPFFYTIVLESYLYIIRPEMNTIHKLTLISSILIACFAQIQLIQVCRTKHLTAQLEPLLDLEDNLKHFDVKKYFKYNINNSLEKLYLKMIELESKVTRLEKENEALVLYAVEKNQYKTLGEQTHIIVHNIIGQLHVIKFCTDTLYENLIHNDYLNKYIFRLSLNLNDTLALITSLRAKIKSDFLIDGTSNLVEAHNHVIKLLEIETSHNSLIKNKIELDSDLRNLELSVPQSDLIEILNTIYKTIQEVGLQLKVNISEVNINQSNYQIEKTSLLIQAKLDENNDFITSDFKGSISTSGLQILDNSQSLILVKHLLKIHNGSLIYSITNSTLKFILELPISSHITRCSTEIRHS